MPSDDEIFERMARLFRDLEFKPPRNTITHDGQEWYINGVPHTWEQIKEYIDEQADGPKQA